MPNLFKKTLSKLHEEKDLEKRFFRYSSLATSILAGISLITNFISDLGVVLEVLSVFFTVLSFSCFYYSNNDKNYKLVRSIFFLGLILLLDVSYFFSGGLDSSITYIFIILFLVLNLVIKRKKNRANIYIFLFYYKFIVNVLFRKIDPELLTPYKSDDDKYLDLIVGFTMISCLISVTINFFKATYEELLYDIEVKNKS